MPHVISLWLEQDYVIKSLDYDFMVYNLKVCCIMEIEVSVDVYTNGKGKKFICKD